MRGVVIVERLAHPVLAHVRMKLPITVRRAPEEAPGRSVRGERANFTRLVLGCIEADFCK